MKTEPPKPPGLQTIDDLTADGAWGFRQGALPELVRWVRWAVSEIEFMKQEIERLNEELYG